MKILKKFLTVSLLAFAAIFAFAGEPLKLNIKSEALGKGANFIVFLPEDFKQDGEAYNVIYILHGAGGSMNVWAKNRPDLSEIATRMRTVFVLPNAPKSWYWDSPKIPNSNYETFIIKELVPHIEKTYNTRKDRRGRAIVGNSMGGHGALWLAMRNPDIFGACGSQSGAVDITTIAKSASVIEHLGKYDDNKKVWENHSIRHNLDALKAAELAILLDCGYEDQWYKANKEIHAAMEEKGIPHDYYVRSGKHDWTYWKSAFDYQLLFFDKYFNAN